MKDNDTLLSLSCYHTMTARHKVLIAYYEPKQQKIRVLSGLDLKDKKKWSAIGLNGENSILNSLMENINI
jgi:hypothetical protein